MATYWIGVDVGKRNLDIQHKSEALRLENQDKSISTWMKSIKKSHQNISIACEATGGYEKTLTRLARKYELTVCVIHPNRIRYFAKTKGQLAKTDSIDAAIIYEYATLMNPQPKTCYLSENEEELRELLKRRDQLMGDRTREKTRVDKEHNKAVKKSIHSHIKHLNKQVEQIEMEIKTLTSQESLRKKINLLTSIPGVGQVAAVTLIAYLPELGKISSKELASLVGVAPYNRDSGSIHGKRYIQGGRNMIRKVMYMVALVASRFNKDIRIFYCRLRANGKCAKVALTAVMNKMISMLNSVVKRKTPWVENMA